MSELRVYLFGPPRVARAGKFVDIGLRKAEALLAYLVMARNSQARDSLSVMFWPDDDQGKARANLRRAIWRIRQALGEQALEADRLRVGIAADTNLWVDVSRFRQCLEQQSAHRHRHEGLCPQCLSLLGEATALYADHFLAGFSLPDCPDFDEWQYFSAAELRDGHAIALEKLAVAMRSQGDYGQAIKEARRMLALDLLHEPAHRLLMELYSANGQTTAALRQYQECARILDVELHAQPALETTELYEAVRRGAMGSAASQVQAIDVPTSHPGRGSAPAARYAMPVQPTSFVGRVSDLTTIGQHLADPRCRLLTLVGPGGNGKTRLAIRAAELYAADLSSGALFVPLDAVRDSGQATSIDSLVSTIADAMGFSFHDGSEPQTQLLAFLRRMEMLLLLDNMDRLLDAAPFLRDLLDDAPGVKVLVTSRERLRLRSEWIYVVSGLGYPCLDETAEQDTQGCADERMFDALELFRERARQLDSLAGRGEDSEAVARICRLVEGMPLAVELAAAWTRVLSCQEIADRIERSAGFLTSDLRDVPARQSSIRSLFEDSWSLLREHEKRVLARLSVFPAGFTYEAAESVADAHDSHLASLVDKSLVQHAAGGRFRLHPLLREFAQDKLALDAGVYEATRQAHAIYYAAFMRNLRPQLEGRRQLPALRAMELDATNLYASWDWAVERMDLDMLDDALVSLVYYFEYRGHIQRGERLLRKAANAVREYYEDGAAPSRQVLVVLGNVLNNLGWFEWRRGVPSAEAHIAEGVQLLRQAEPAPCWDLAAAVQIHAIASGYLDTRRGTELQREALALAEEDGDAFLIGAQKMSLGQAEEQRGEYRRAIIWLEASVAELEQIGEVRFRSFALHSLGRTFSAMGRYEWARNYFRHAWRVREEFGDRVGIAYSYLDLGKLAKAQGRYGRAQAHIEASAAVSDEIGTAAIAAQCLMEEADVARRIGELQNASSLLEQANSAVMKLGLVTLSLTWHDYAARLARDRTDMPEALRQARASLELAQEVGHRGAEAIAACLLGHILSAGGADNTRRSGEYLAHGWAIAETTGVTPVALDILAGLAQVYLINGRDSESPTAQALLSLVRRHPAADAETRQWAERLVADSNARWGASRELTGVVDEMDVWKMGSAVLVAPGA